MNPHARLVKGLRPDRTADAIFVNAPLKDYDEQPRLNDFTLPVLGLGYIATYAAQEGFNVGVLDAEALGLGPERIASVVNDLRPRWVGFNLLAPTCRHAARSASLLDESISVMVGGHHAKALPQAILEDHQFPRIDALVMGEGEYIVSALLDDLDNRRSLPGVSYRDPRSGRPLRSEPGPPHEQRRWTAPDIDTLPFVDRKFFTQDPFRASDGRIETNFVGSRGCPYECSFCGAAKSANPDITIRTRDPDNIVDEMEYCKSAHGVTAVRFVDDLFLASLGFMRKALPRFIERGVGDHFVWDATGRINTLAKADDDVFRLMVRAGCREVAIGIESGSARMLEYIDKRLSPEMIRTAVKRLLGFGIDVKGYIILGFPGESLEDMLETRNIVQDLWVLSDQAPGSFRCSVFEFRPYPGTREWARILATGAYSESQLLNYEHVDLTESGGSAAMQDRDEFNFSVNLPFANVPIPVIRQLLTEMMTLQKQRASLA